MPEVRQGPFTNKVLNLTVYHLISKGIFPVFRS